MPRDRKADPVPAVIATMAFVSHAFEMVLRLEEYDGEDHLVLVEQIDAAGNHLAEAIWALHPQWRELDRRAAEREALQLFREHRPDFDDEASGRRAIVESLQEALTSSATAARKARDRGSQRRYRDVALAMDDASDHLENALYLLNPDAFRDTIDATTPTQRVKLASRLEVIELELDEHRAMIRARLAPELN